MWSAASTARFGEVDCGLWNQSKNLDISIKTMGLLSLLIKNAGDPRTEPCLPALLQDASRHHTGIKLQYIVQ